MFHLQAVLVSGDPGSKWHEGGVCQYLVTAFINDRMLWSGPVEHKRSQGWWVLLAHIVYAAATKKGTFYD